MDYYEIDHIDQRVDDMPDYDIYEPTSAEIWATCAWPSLQQILKYSLPFIFWNIAFRITTQTCKYIQICMNVAMKITKLVIK